MTRYYAFLIEMTPIPRKHIYRLLILFLLPLTETNADTYCGLILDTATQPIQGARVRFQNTKVTTVSDQNGRYCLDSEGSQSAITAWQQGFYIGGIGLPAEGFSITLRRAPQHHGEYEWLYSTRQEGAPRHPDTEPCENCHTRLTREWIASGHGRSHTNPLFGSVREVAMKDFGDTGKQCALCHQPQGSNKPIGCDFCHKIKDVVGLDSQRLGVERIQLLTPEKDHIFFGPIDDIWERSDTYEPLYQESEYCASCHQGNFWRTEVYSTFSEWRDSSYAKTGTTCQDCHMKTSEVYLANPDDGGLKRDPQTLSSHDFSISSLLTKAISLKTDAEFNDDHLSVDITVSNTGTGHHVPSGSPLRHLLLIVSVQTPSGMLRQISGSTVPTWADTQYRSLPGKAYARVLKEIPNYRGSRKQHFKPVYPAPFWRPSLIESDNRIAANDSDISHYEFELNGAASAAISVELLYFEHFSHWMSLKAATPVTMSSINRTIEK